VYTLREPVGVVGAILPWNGPLGMMATRVAAALSAGCCIVVKPAEHTPLSALRFAKLAQQVGIPDGVINVVTGGSVAGRALAEHKLVDKITFTGSTETGKSIVRAAAGNLKRVSLELGGKSPVIIMSDADIESAIVGASNGIFWNAGQICVAGSRLYAHEKVFDQVLDGIARIAQSLQVGSGLEATTDIGPLISSQQRERVTKYIDSGLAQGAELVAGGSALAGDGYFIQPTILANTRGDMRVVREEIFGPVLCVMKMNSSDLDAIIDTANDSDYGLSAYVWTRDLSTAHMLARRLKSGSVRINGGIDLDAALPFGGVKQSGWGRDNGREGIEMYFETKAVSIRL
jgi:phenylacetaldehyde dehydrogenase